MDFIRPGIVTWKRVKTLEQQSKMAAKRLQEVLGNCNYAVELGKKLNFVLVGIAGREFHLSTFFIDDFIIRFRYHGRQQDADPGPHLAADESVHLVTPLSGIYSIILLSNIILTMFS